jgi:hypothetical protein
MDELHSFSTTCVTILTKHSLFSFLGLVRAELVESDAEAKPFTAIVKLDPREGQPLLKQFNTNREAVRSYEDALSTSLERGWSVVYRGQPLQG